MNIKITVKKIVDNSDLSKIYENSDYYNDKSNLCPMKLGMEFISKDGLIPECFCNSAWHDLNPYIDSLNKNIDLYPNWMKKPKTAMISCNDGFHPVIFYLEVIE